MFDLALDCLRRGHACALLLVVASDGSSPGRAGFRMVVAPDGRLAGSIGGGIMEHKLVELARAQLAAGSLAPLLKRQIHQAEAPAERSGMICSGEQTVAILPLHPAQLTELEALLAALAARSAGHFVIDHTGHIAVHAEAPLPVRQRYAPGPHWTFAERLDPRPTVRVVGAGHVALACCELLHRLDFRVCLYDDRPELNTLAQNTFADETRVVPYAEIGPWLAGAPDEYVVIMTFGYRTDAVVVRQVLGKPWRYVGLLGSAAKVAKLLADLRADGYPETALAALHAPIGLPIHSRTPWEIAVSVAAELISVRNAPQ